MVNVPLNRVSDKIKYVFKENKNIKIEKMLKILRDAANNQHEYHQSEKKYCRRNVNRKLWGN